MSNDWYIEDLIPKRILKKYQITLVSYGPWGTRIQFAKKNGTDYPRRWCCEGKTKNELSKSLKKFT